MAEKGHSSWKNVSFKVCLISSTNRCFGGLPTLCTKREDAISADSSPMRLILHSQISQKKNSIYIETSDIVYRRGGIPSGFNERWWKIWVRIIRKVACFQGSRESRNGQLSQWRNHVSALNVDRIWSENTHKQSIVGVYKTASLHLMQYEFFTLIFFK